MSSSWTAFEYRIWKNFKEYQLHDHNNFILAISGGLDSMLLLDVFLKLKPLAQIKVAYFHHGANFNVGDENIQHNYRDKAYELVKHKISEINKNNVVFCFKKSTENLINEDLMRTARWNYLKSLKSSDEIIVTAHHLDDRLETMLIKMIRGTSIDGFLAFTMWNNEIFRPLLELSKFEILAQAQKQGLDWVEDPSNQDDRYLRNWIREIWLKELDNRVESGSKNLAKSLLKITNSASDNPRFDLVLESVEDLTVLSRQWYVSLSKNDQLRSLALFLKKHQIFSFTSGHLEEIRKRLDKNQKDITFEILGRKWVINAFQIMLR